MHEIIEKVKQEIRSIWCYRWHVLAATWFIALAGWIFIAMMPDMYKASARVYVETQSVLRPLLQDITVQSDVLNTVELMRSALLARPNVEKLARETGITDGNLSPYQLEMLLQDLSQRISIVPDLGGKNLYWIEYMDADPVMAEKLVSTMLSGFVASIQGSSKTDNTMAQRFLDDQIVDYEKRLEISEIALRDFKLTNVGYMPSDGADYYQRLQLANTELNQTTLELQEVEQSLASLNRQADGEEPTFGFSNSNLENNETRSLDERINQLQRQLDDLLVRYTDQHPDVTQLRETLASLTDQKRQITDKLALFGMSSRPQENPIYQQLQIARGTKQAEAAALRVRRKEHQERVNQLSQLIDKGLSVEAELTKLNRDYNVIKTQYEILLARREAARLTGDVERVSDEVQFKVLDPPLTPVRPAWPSRFLFNTLALIVAIGAGIGFGYLMSQIKPMFHDGRDLSSLGLPLLGVVTQHFNAEKLQKQQLRIKQFTGAAGGLFGIYFLFLLIF